MPIGFCIYSNSARLVMEHNCIMLFFLYFINARIQYLHANFNDITYVFGVQSLHTNILLFLTSYQ